MLLLSTKETFQYCLYFWSLSIPKYYPGQSSGLNMVFQIYFYFNQNLEISRTHCNPSPSTTPPPIFLLLRLRLCNLDDIPGATALTMKMKNDSGSEKKR